MLKTAAIALVALPLALMAVVLSSSCVVVDVKQANGPRIVVPVPLALAKTALAFAPQEARHVEVPELARYHDVAQRIVDELSSAPDGILVEVRDGGEHVVVEKVGGSIEVHVDGHDEMVDVSLPLSVLAEVLESYDGEEIETRGVLSALSSVSRSEIVHVKSDDEEVKVWVW